MLPIILTCFKDKVKQKRLGLLLAEGDIKCD